MKKKTILFFAFSLLFSPLALVHGEQGGNSNSEAANLRAEARANRQDLREEKCKNVESRIEAKLNKYESGNISVEDVHKRLKTRLGNLATKLENNGIDASKLKSDLATLNEKIDKVASDYDAFILALKETKNYACGESQGQFREKLQAAKKLLVTVRKDRQDTRNFIVNTIIPDIKALREQLEDKIQEQNNNQ